MKYVGSKGRHASEILPIILQNRKEGQAYVEPFVGGCNTMARVAGRRIGGDLHGPLICLWKAVADGWNPREEIAIIDEQEYRFAQASARNGIVEPGIAFLGFSLSYGGKWFGGYRRDRTGKRNYAEEALKSADKEFPKLAGVAFHHCGYADLPIPDSSIVYCDPPYKDTLGYATGDFDHDAFWQWVREMSAKGHRVFVSEYTAPSDFICVWQKRVKNTLDGDTGAKSGVEKLWVHYSQE